MSNVLKRIQKAKKKPAPEGVKNDVAELYIEDIKKAERAAAHKEIMDDLVSAAESAEMDTALAKIEGMTKEIAAIKISLAQSNEVNKKLEQEITSLKTNESIALLSEKETNDARAEAIKKLTDALQETRVALAASEARQPVTIKAEDPLPSFEFTPVRGPDGRTQSVKARPI